jgi:ATP synthase protein I
MADDAREKNGGRDRPATGEAALSARLQRLGERLAQHHTVQSSNSDSVERAAAGTSAIARGFRLSAELVAGVGVGIFIGWLLDRWLGTSPWGLLVFLLLGFAAGVLNVMRAAGVIPNRTLDPPGSMR